MQLAFVAALLCGTLAYGAWRLSAGRFRAGPAYRPLQGNLDQRLRIAAHRSPEAQATVQAAYTDLCMQAAKLHPRPDLIVWPETSYPGIWVDLLAAYRRHQDQHPDAKTTRHRARTAPHGRPAGPNQCAAWPQHRLSSPRRRNSAAITPRCCWTRKASICGRYDKIHRVPFGEYVPLRDWLPFMNCFSPYDFDYSIGPGDGLTRASRSASYHFGVLICYEDTDPFMARDYGVTTADGPPVDFLLNISNDGWFDGTSEHEEHLAICRFRAIEARRAWLARSTWASRAVIDSNGRVIAPVKSADNNPGRARGLVHSVRRRSTPRSGRERLAPVQAHGRHPGVRCADRPPHQPVCHLWRLAPL